MKPNKHFYTLDFLRGIAALLVVLFHFSGTTLSKITQESTRSLFSWGYLGVDIFFVISGFIIPYVLYKSDYTVSSIGAFLGKRFVRICPPSYVIMLLTILQFFIVSYFHLSKNAWFEKLSLEQVIHNFLYTIPFTPFEWLNGIFWTLAVEFQYYIFIGLLFPLLFRNVTTFFISSLLISSLYYTPLAQSVGYFEYSSLFFIGSVTMLYYIKKVNVVTYLLLLSVYAIIGYLQLGWLPALFGLLTALLIAFVEVKNRPAAFLGKISYSLYLTHILVGTSFEILLVRLFPPTSPLVRSALLGASVVIAIAAAYVFHLLLEKYFIDLSNRLFKKEDRRELKLVKQPVVDTSSMPVK